MKRAEHNRGSTHQNRHCDTRNNILPKRNRNGKSQRAMAKRITAAGDDALLDELGL